MSLREIARELGISATAVSLALKNSPRISPGLKDRVQHAARRHGYVPNPKLAEMMGEMRRSAGHGFRASLGAFSLYPEEKPWETRPHLNVVLEAARECALVHGYNLEYFWLRRPKLTSSRLASILASRGIQGLLCLGGLDPEERLPAELRRFAVVTFGASVPGSLHRVISHFMADAVTLFNELRARGYERPGLVITRHGDRRTSHAYTAVCLGMQERVFTPPHVPILRAEEWNAAAFDAWFDAHRPDVLVLHQFESYIASLEEHLRHRHVRISRDVGIAMLDMNPDPSRYSGVCQDFKRMGLRAAELLIGRIMLHDIDPPSDPRIEMVMGHWNEGHTLVKPRTS